jgi:hypothetical protein
VRVVAQAACGDGARHDKLCAAHPRSVWSL